MRITTTIVLGVLAACGGPPDLSIDTSLVDEPNAAIIAGADLSRTIDVDSGGAVMQGTVEVLLNHPAPGELTLTLTSAQGTEVEIEPRIAEGSDDYRYAIPLLAVQGESQRGTWRLTIDASAATAEGTLYAWALEL